MQNSKGYIKITLAFTKKYFKQRSEFNLTPFRTYHDASAIFLERSISVLSPPPPELSTG